MPRLSQAPALGRPRRQGAQSVLGDKRSQHVHGISSTRHVPRRPTRVLCSLQPRPRPPSPTPSRGRVAAWISEGAPTGAALSISASRGMTRTFRPGRAMQLRGRPRESGCSAVWRRSWRRWPGSEAPRPLAEPRAAAASQAPPRKGALSERRRKSVSVTRGASCRRRPRRWIRCRSLGSCAAGRCRCRQCPSSQSHARLRSEPQAHSSPPRNRPPHRITPLNSGPKLSCPQTLSPASLCSL